MEKINYCDPFEFAEEDIDKTFRKGFGLETGMPQQAIQPDVPIVIEPEKAEAPKSISHMTKPELIEVGEEYGLELVISMKKDEILSKVKEAQERGA